MKNWYLLIISLSTENATARMRIWRSLKSSGAAVLRDGVYLMPDRPDCLDTLETQAAEVRNAGGTAFVLPTCVAESEYFISLFDRSEDYTALLADIGKLAMELSAEHIHEQVKQSRKLGKAFASLSAIDFFPNAAQAQTETELRQLEIALAGILSPNEPHAVDGVIPRLNLQDYQSKTWATRQRPWVDRLACAWLILRYIDRQAHIIWLSAPTECPDDAIGFDYDGAQFSHIDGRVSFEVLLASFGLETPALKRLGGVVHFLDVGGIQPAEAIGVETVLAGLRESILDDDQLLAAAISIFDSLMVSFLRKSG